MWLLVGCYRVFAIGSISVQFWLSGGYGFFYCSWLLGFYEWL